MAVVRALGVTRVEQVNVLVVVTPYHLQQEGAGAGGWPVAGEGQETAGGSGHLLAVVAENSAGDVGFEGIAVP